MIKWLSDDCEVVLGRIVGDPRLPPRSDSGQGDPSSCCQVPRLGIHWNSEGDGLFLEEGGRKRRVTLEGSSSDEPTATVMRADVEVDLRVASTARRRSPVNSKTAFAA